ncbi:MAG: amidohydrolase family protein [Acidobacteriota bacterium]
MILRASLRFAWFPLLILLAACGGGGPGGGQALVGVTVIDGRGSPPLRNQVVRIQDGRIAEVAPAEGYEAPHDTQLIELPGRFVMPGLIDLHAHVTVLPLQDDSSLADTIDVAASERLLETLLAFGITTVRNPAAPAEAGIALRERARAGEIRGPRIVTTGEALNRTAPAFGPFVATPDEASVRQEIARQAALGVDAIKVYSALPPELVTRAIEETNKLNLPIIGHLQRTTWTEGARLGMEAITHAAPWSSVYLPEAEREGYRGTIRDRMTWLEKVDFDGPEIRQMIELLAEKKVTVDPTLIAMHTKFFGDDPQHRENSELRLAPAVSRQAWERFTFVDDWTPDDFARGRAVWPRLLEFTRRLHSGGVRLAAGSDTPNPWVIPGVSLHQEIELLHDAGISPLSVLRIATYNGAVALGLEDEIGSIEPGKVADLIVLTADPTVLLSNTRAISHVFQGGRFLDPSAILSSQLE